MDGGTVEDNFPAVGGVKADKRIGEENDDKGFGSIAESRDNFVDEGLDRGNLLLAINDQAGKGEDRD